MYLNSCAFINFIFRMNDKTFMGTRKLLYHSISRPRNGANQIKIVSRKFHQKSEETSSFNTNGTISELISKMPLATSMSVIFTGYPDWPYTKLKQNVNLTEFYKGTQTSKSYVMKPLISKVREQPLK